MAEHFGGVGGHSSEAEMFRRAIQWISARREERPDLDLRQLVSEASRQFDLSPRDELALLSLVAGEHAP